MRQGLTRHILLDPAGAPVAATAAARARPLSRWSFIRDKKALGVVAPGLSAAAPPQEEPVLVDVVRPEDYVPGKTRNWTLLTDAPVTASDLLPLFHPASARAAVTLPPIAADAHSPTDFKAKRLNRESWVKGVFVDLGGLQSVATRFFEASSSHAVFDTLSFPDKRRARGRYGDKGHLTEKAYLKRLLERELARIGPHPKHRRFVLATDVQEAGPNALRGMLGLVLEGQPGRAPRKTVVSFRLSGGTWQERRNALAALGVNLLYYARFGEETGTALPAGLGDDMGAVKLTATVLR